MVEVYKIKRKDGVLFFNFQGFVSYILVVMHGRQILGIKMLKHHRSIERSTWSRGHTHRHMVPSQNVSGSSGDISNLLHSRCKRRDGSSSRLRSASIDSSSIQQLPFAALGCRHPGGLHMSRTLKSSTLAACPTSRVRAVFLRLVTAVLAAHTPTSITIIT